MVGVLTASSSHTFLMIIAQNSCLHLRVVQRAQNPWNAYKNCMLCVHGRKCTGQLSNMFTITLHILAATHNQRAPRNRQDKVHCSVRSSRLADASQRSTQRQNRATRSMAASWSHLTQRCAPSSLVVVGAWRPQKAQTCTPQGTSHATCPATCPATPAVRVQGR